MNNFPNVDIAAWTCAVVTDDDDDRDFDIRFLLERPSHVFFFFFFLDNKSNTNPVVSDRAAHLFEFIPFYRFSVRTLYSERICF